MQYRQLGESGLTVSALGLGTMGMSPGLYGAVNDEESIATIRRALDIGITLIDTANLYGGGHNELLVGQAIKGQRDKVVLATKFGFVVGSDGTLSVNGRTEHVREQIELSLQRLGADYIDLYYLHRIDPTIPIEETVGAMAELVRAGKVRYLGLSEANVENVRRAHAVHPITAVQSEYSLWSRGPQEQLFPTLRELGIGFVAYMPLGAGFLTGKIKSTSDLAENDFRHNLPRYAASNLEHNLKLANAVRLLAERQGITPAQLALAWLLQQGQDIVPIFGTRHQTNLESNAQATEISLTQPELAQLNQLLEQNTVAGDRAPEFLKGLNQ